MIQISAPAKINLCIDILKKDESLYHEIRTVFHELPHFKDELKFYETQEEDSVSTTVDPEFLTSHPYPARLPKQKDNLAHKTLKLLKEDQNIHKNAKIEIYKKIPLSSGLGGASSDAAATLKGLNLLWNLNLSKEYLLNLASQLGADVPFFILGGTALGEHYGEILTPLPYIDFIEFKVDKMAEWPKTPQTHTLPSKTAQMYDSLNLSLCGNQTKKTDNLIEAIREKDPHKLAQNLHNDFETLYNIKPPHHLSGSGPAIFTISYL